MAILAFTLLAALLETTASQPRVWLDIAFDGGAMRPRLQATAIEEVTYIWSQYGVDVRLATATHTEWDCALGVSVVLDDRGNGGATGALGSISFQDDLPAPAIVLYPAAIVALTSTATVRGLGHREWPDVLRDVIVGRVLGRALAHEIGHFLLRSRQHSPDGLMRARHAATYLTSPDRHGFELSVNDARAVMVRLRDARAQMCGGVGAPGAPPLGAVE